MKYYQETQPEMLDYIIRQCIKHNNMDYEHAMGTLHLRYGNMIKWRHQAAFIIRAVYPDYPVTRIARVLGKKNHATVLNSIKKVAQWYQTEKAYRDDFDKLIDVFYARGVMTAAQVAMMKRILMYR